MKNELTTENIKEYAQNVMDSRQVRDFNAWAGTAYKNAAELLEAESDEKLLSFYEPAAHA